MRSENTLRYGHLMVALGIVTLPIPVLDVSFEPLLVIVSVIYLSINLLYSKKHIRVPRRF